MHKNLYAYTPNTSPYPEFVSLNCESDGRIVLTVREAAKPDQFSDKDCGATIQVELPSSELERLATAAQIAANNLKIMGNV